MKIIYYLFGAMRLSVITYIINNNIYQRICKGAFVWDQSGIRIIGIVQVSVRLAALGIPEYLDFHSGYSAPRSRIARIYSRIFPNERALRLLILKNNKSSCNRQKPF